MAEPEIAVYLGRDVPAGAALQCRQGLDSGRGERVGGGRGVLAEVHGAAVDLEPSRQHAEPAARADDLDALGLVGLGGRDVDRAGRAARPLGQRVSGVLHLDGVEPGPGPADDPGGRPAGQVAEQVEVVLALVDQDAAALQRFVGIGEIHILFHQERAQMFVDLLQRGVLEGFKGSLLGVSLLDFV